MVITDDMLGYYIVTESPQENLSSPNHKGKGQGCAYKNNNVHITHKEPNGYRVETSDI